MQRKANLFKKLPYPGGNGAGWDNTCNGQFGGNGGNSGNGTAGGAGNPGGRRIGSRGCGGGLGGVGGHAVVPMEWSARFTNASIIERET